MTPLEEHNNRLRQRMFWLVRNKGMTYAQASEQANREFAEAGVQAPAPTPPVKKRTPTPHSALTEGLT